MDEEDQWYMKKVAYLLFAELSGNGGSFQSWSAYRLVDGRRSGLLGGGSDQSEQSDITGEDPASHQDCN